MTQPFTEVHYKNDLSTVLTTNQITSNSTWRMWEPNNQSITFISNQTNLAKSFSSIKKNSSFQPISFTLYHTPIFYHLTINHIRSILNAQNKPKLVESRVSNEFVDKCPPAQRSLLCHLSSWVICCDTFRKWRVVSYILLPQPLRDGAGILNSIGKQSGLDDWILTGTNCSPCKWSYSLILGFLASSDSQLS